jgi:hypothetical protein
MSDAPERIWVGVSELGDLAINHKGEKLNGYDHVEYARADRIEALTEQLEAARADAKEAEAYAEELEAKNGNLCDLAANEHGRAERAEAKLAKAVKALLLVRVHVANNEQGWSVGRASARSDLKIINATLAEIEGSNAP